VYDLGPETTGSFDLVFCGSLLLHLKSPLLALERIRSVTRGIAIIETAISPELERQLPEAPAVWFGAFAESETGSENTHWLMTTTALERMLEYAGFIRTERRGVFDLAPGGPTVTVVVAHAA
jgi:tRNA (mo5U34)-methyltransferase